jgi:hypothetical protein
LTLAYVYVPGETPDVESPSESRSTRTPPPATYRRESVGVAPAVAYKGVVALTDVTPLPPAEMMVRT